MEDIMKVHIRWIVVTLSLALMATGAVVFAQDKQQEGAAKQERQLVFERRADVMVAAGQEAGPRMPPPRIMGEGNTFFFIETEMASGRKLVKGAPYSAQAVTESVHTLADGNRIVRKTTASVYRDSEGRTRQDLAVGNIGPYAMAGDPSQTVIINDPVSGAHYMLEPQTKTARKMSLPRVEMTRPNDKDSKANVTVEVAPAQGAEPRRAPVMRERVWVGGEVGGKEPARKTESLGKQVIEGVEAEGTRETMTIAAGEIGNELPIQIVFERWYSPELQMVVMSKHTDPRVGENTYRLTGINRSEPSHSLFEVPSDYTVKESVSPEMRFKLEREIQQSKKRSNEQ
jgi:hypothetical protein